MTAAAGARYDAIGRTYGRTRREDPHVAAQVHAALGDARTIVNVGAGSGSYEPADRAVVAVEPSVQMIRQRAGRPAPVVRGVAEALPFADGSFDLALAVLTAHHWTDAAAGLGELARVAARQVVLYFEPLRNRDFWAIEYFPAALDLPSEIDPPGERLLAEHLDLHEVRPVLVPRDCLDGFGVAFWARPEAYLDPDVQSGMSWLAMLPADDLARGTAALRADLASGAWDRRHGHLRTEDVYDGGYRLALAG
ncbi:class I SAM-dependent methyltransferase [Aquihabitans sp. G128]|uniref:class I SAM-dependent methyltransferase n=1 Tax=Aquihabitans sp. G128 TaxID=2849779 RepID=UPI001C23DAD2|nr:class I SAM-dependent methyltransferase [Aquihabitans sp. G128]QXC61975.1 class I SAM-dependent methyltransferase [Aquihabitans sp. G128]